MKKIIYSLLAAFAALALASCAKEPGLKEPARGGKPVPVTFSLDLGSALTKAAPESSVFDDASGEFQLYAAAFSGSDGSLLPCSRIGGTGFQPVETISGRNASVTLTLSGSQDCRVVFFAMREGAYDVRFADGNVASFAFKRNLKANDASLDAFYASVEVKSSSTNYDVTMKRPFAQINVLVRSDNVPAGQDSFSSAMSVLAPVSFDLFAGAAGSGLEEIAFAENAIQADAVGQYNDSHVWIGMNYVLVPASGAVTVTSFRESGMASAVRVGQVPVKANGRTNLVGNVYNLSDFHFSVLVDPGFGSEDEHGLGGGGGIGGGGGGGDADKAVLTNAEICAATLDALMTDESTHYGEASITSASGVWNGNFARNKNGLPYLQLRNKKGACVISPVFSAGISRVEVTLTGDESVNLSDRTLHAVPAATVLPTGQANGKDILYSETEWAAEYGCVRTGTEKGATVKIDFPEGGDVRQFMLIVEGGATYIDHIEVFCGTSGGGGGEPAVTTGAASSVTTAGAVLSGSFANMKDVRDYGFYWGTSSTALTEQTHLNSSASGAESFSSTLSSLEASTTYFYQAYVEVLDGGELKEYKGAVKSFTTASSAGQGGYRPYLSGYEIPAISLKVGTTYGSGDELSGYGYKWFNHETANAMQKVVTHTYKSGGKTVRNYTCLVDGNKMAPLWSAFVMHKDAYPDNGVGRNDGWRNDPAIPSSWQQSGVSGYSRGHFVASNYRQATKDANKATFYHTNQAPQYQTSFNDGVWNSLEQSVKSNAPSGRDTLYVVVGVLYENSKTVSGVPIPSHFYKLLMKCSFDTAGGMTAARGVAYVFTNEAHKGEQYNDSKFRTTIDAIEERTGFNFFVNVPPDLQDAAERQSASLW